MKNELWSRRSLIWNFAISDLKIRYRNSVLGFFWSFLEPLLLLSVLYVVFTNVFKSQIQYFPLYILLGLIMWNMLARGTQIGLNSIVSRRGLLTQVYFPREIPAISSAITSSLMFCLELVVFGIFMVVFRFMPPSTIIILPLVLILEFVLVLGLSFPLSVLNARYKDIQFIWSVILQAGFFLTPIFYKLDILPPQIQKIMSYTPLVQIVNMAHDVTLYGKIPTPESIQIAVITTAVIFGICYAIFRKAQKRTIEEM
jgi:lipopolysaccharide transport system permease protein